MNCQAIAGADACLSMIRETVFFAPSFSGFAFDLFGIQEIGNGLKRKFFFPHMDHLRNCLLLFFVFQEILSVFRKIISIRDNPTVLPTLFL
jgi:hypothetical protein